MKNLADINHYEEHFEVMSHDVDANNNAKPSVLVRFFQETANHHMRDRRPTYYELFEQGKSYILIRMKCRMNSPLHPYDKIKVSTWTSEGKGATFKRNYLMTGEGDREGEEIGRAYSEWAVVDWRTGTILKIDDVDYSNYEVDEEIDIDLPTKFHFPKEMEFVKCGAKEILYTDCDMNLHMNNTRYQDTLWSYVPDVSKKVMTGFTMRFMKEGALGKTLEIFRGEPVPADSSNRIDGSNGVNQTGTDTTDIDTASTEETWYFKTMVNDDEGDPKINVEAMFTCTMI